MRRPLVSNAGMPDGSPQGALDSIFEDGKTIPPRVLWFIGLIWVVTLAVYRLYGVDFDASKFFHSDASTKFLADSGLAVATNIFAGTLFAYFLRTRESNRERLFRSLGDKEFLKELIDGVLHYRHITRQDFRVTARLYPHPTNHGYFMLALRYEYRQSSINKNFRAVIYRKTAETKVDSYPNIAEECFIHEFVWYADESTFPSAPTVDDYCITELTVDKARHVIQKEEKTGNIYFSCDLPQQPEPYAYLSYIVMLPIEKAGAITISAEFPTDGATVSFDYKEVVAQIIQPSCFPKAGLKYLPLDMSNHDVAKFEYRHDGWLLPKDNFTFVWWPKSN
ncbi:MAG: hypothetical protein H6R18_2069 [Proteobacteria bacterium]|nr:hypothetical protein [Pseudomonadota bacterium]